MNRKERAEQLEKTLETAFAELEDQLKEGHTENYLQLPDWYSEFRSYSPANVLLIKDQLPSATQVAGYRKWEELGYHVRQGETALWVRGPYLKKVADPETGELEQRLIGWLALPVFDVSQLVEGVDLATIGPSVQGDACLPLYLAAREAIRGSGIQVREEILPKGIRGVSEGGRILIQPGLAPEKKYLILLHELLHEVLHKDETRKETTREQRELEAESGSYVLAKIHGVTNPHSRDYIISWQGTVAGLHESLSRIHLALRRCMEILSSPVNSEVTTAA